VPSGSRGQQRTQGVWCEENDGRAVNAKVSFARESLFTGDFMSEVRTVHECVPMMSL